MAKIKPLKQAFLPCAFAPNGRQLKFAGVRLNAQPEKPTAVALARQAVALMKEKRIDGNVEVQRISYGKDRRSRRVFFVKIQGGEEVGHGS